MNNRKRFRRLAMAMTLVLTAGSLAGCGSGSSAGTADETEGSTAAEETDAAEETSAEDSDGADAGSSDEAAGDDSSAESDDTAAGESSESDSASEKPDLVYGTNMSWNTLFPYNTNSTNGTMVANKLFTLLVVPGDGEPEYMAAESLESEEDGYVIRVHLNPDCTWSDGTPCTAEDWVWTFETVTDPDFGTYYRTSYFNVIAGTDDAGVQVEGETFGVEYVDEYTFTIRHKSLESIDDFVDDARQYFCMPKHLLGDLPVSEIADNDYWTHPVGNGPCVFVEEPTSGQELVLQARDDYFLGELPFNLLTNIVVDSSNAANAFLNGEIDMYYPALSDSDIDEIVGQNGIQMSIDNSSRTETALCINNEIVPTNVRKAIDLLVDKDVLAEIATNGAGQPEGDLLNNTTSWSLPYTFERDVDGAVALLDEIGYDTDTVYTLGCTDSTQNVAIAIQQFLAEGGIQVELVTADGTTVFADQRSGDIDMCIVSYTSNYSPTCMSMITTNGATMTHITEDKWDDYISAISWCTDEDEKLELIHEYQQALRDECPVVALYSKPMRLVTSSKVTNVYAGFHDFCWKWITQ